MQVVTSARRAFPRLNESPSEKEGKFVVVRATTFRKKYASMKALPKRKGNQSDAYAHTPADSGLNESPSEKEGKYRRLRDMGLRANHQPQ